MNIKNRRADDSGGVGVEMDCGGAQNILSDPKEIHTNILTHKCLKRGDGEEEEEGTVENTFVAGPVGWNTPAEAD